MLLQCAIKGDLEMTMKICEIHQLDSILRVTGEYLELDLLGHNITTEDWNPLHFAIYFKHVELVKYYMEIIKLNPRLTLMGPLD